MRSSLTLDLLRTVSWPHWRSHVTRTVLTMVGVALGIATVVGIAHVNASVLASFRHMVDTVAGPATIEVRSAAGGVDEALLPEVQTVGGVEAAAGAVEAFMPLADDPGEQVMLLGVDFLGSPVWERQFPRETVEVEDTLEFLAQLDSVALPQAFLTRRGLAVGDGIRVLAPTGPRTLRIRGVLDDQGPATLFGGALALMDLPAAQRLLGKDGVVDRIAVLVDPATTDEAVRAGLVTAMRGRAEVAAAEARGQQAERLLLTLRAILAMMSVGALIVGGFIVYQTVVVSVQQRQGMLAILNAVGVPRRSLRRLCVVETALLTTLGAGLGLLGGWVLGRVASGSVGEVASQIWLRVDVARHHESPGGMGTGILLALLAAGGSAYLAARSTLRAPTVESLRPGGQEPDDRPTVLRRLGLACLLLAGVWLAVLAPPDMGFLPLVATVVSTQTLAQLALALLAPLVVWAGGSAARRLSERWAGFSGRLATENVVRSWARNGATVATVGAAFAIAVDVAVLVKSFEAGWAGWLQEHFAADLYVGRGDTVRLVAGPPMGPEVGEALAATAGVESVEPFRRISITFRDHPVFLQGLSVENRLARGDLAMVEGDLAGAAPSLLAGTGVLVSDNLSYRLGLHRGDTIDVPTPRGQRAFRVEGTFVDYLGSLDYGSIAIDGRHLATYWDDRLANLYRVWLTPGVSAIEVRRAILARGGPMEGTYVLTAAHFLAGVHEVVDTFFAAVWGLEIVAALVAVIGVLNAQVASVVDRGREITVLRTIGVPGRAIRRMLVFECGQIGFLGGVAGAALGLVLGAQVVLVSVRLATGWQPPLMVPAAMIAAGLGVATLVSAAAGWVPARIADRLAVMPVAND